MTILFIEFICNPAGTINGYVLLITWAIILTYIHPVLPTYPW